MLQNEPCLPLVISTFLHIPRSLQALAAYVGDQEEEMASGELEQRFNKKDFTSMVIHGQFNHGFIMASIGKELFIIDQHAADEKSTFERLQDSLALNKCCPFLTMYAVRIALDSVA